MGRLHLRIARRGDGRWASSSLLLPGALGYGTYRFDVTGWAGGLDRDAVLGLFTYDDAPGEFHREVDIELSRFGDASADPLNFTVQPWWHPGNGRSFAVPRRARRATYGFRWVPGVVTFRARWGHGDPFRGREIARWSLSGGEVPDPGNSTTRINLYSFHGVAPEGGRPQQMVVDRFAFTPPPPRRPR